MKLTVVTAKDGTIVAAQHGDGTPPDTSTVMHLDDFRAGLKAGPNQSIRVIDVPDDFALVTTPSDLEAKLKSALASARA